MAGGYWDDGERPHDKVTLQEIRLAIASLAGPLRANVAGRTRTFELTDQEPKRISVNRQTPVLFVQVRQHPDHPAPIVLVGGEQRVTSDNHETIDLQIGPLQQVLLAGEELYLRATTAGTFFVQVTEVTP